MDSFDFERLESNKLEILSKKTLLFFTFVSITKFLLDLDLFIFNLKYKR
jgi:hypothetical protein